MARKYEWNLFLDDGMGSKRPVNLNDLNHQIYDLNIVYSDGASNPLLNASIEQINNLVFGRAGVKPRDIVLSRQRIEAFGEDRTLGLEGGIY